jgi:hypothetical protein
MRLIEVNPVPAISVDGWTQVNAMTICSQYDNFDAEAIIGYTLGKLENSQFTPIHSGSLSIESDEYASIDWSREGMAKWVCSKLNLSQAQANEVTIAP